MSIAPMWKQCSKCGTIYSYNPSVGQYFCPNCAKQGTEKAVKTLWDWCKYRK